MHSRRSKGNFKKLFVPLTRSDHTHWSRDQGYVLEYDPPGDRNCQFSAVCFGLSLMEIFRSAEILRSGVVNYLSDKEIMNGFPLELFAGVPMK